MANVYIACWLTPEQAQRLTIGKELAENLHMTLCCLGDIDETNIALAQAAIRSVCIFTPVLAGEISGVGRFMGADQDVLYASVDVPELAEFRQRLCNALASVGLEADETHGFSPHITLAYLPPGDEEPDVNLGLPQPITFRSVCVCLPGRAHDPDADIPFGISKDDPGSSDVHVDTPSDEISVAGLDGEQKKRKRKVQLIKTDDEQQLVYGIVLEPNVEDSQGDVCSPEDIEKAAHRFLYANRPIGIQHGVMAPDSVRPVESYIAPADFELGGEMVRKGSWVLVAHVPDEALWDAVKKDGFTGWSVAGTGIRSPLNA